MRPVLWSTSYLLRCPFGISMVTSKSTAAPWVTCSVTAPEDTSLAREPVSLERPWRRRPRDEGGACSRPPRRGEQAGAPGGQARPGSPPPSTSSYGPQPSGEAQPTERRHRYAGHGRPV